MQILYGLAHKKTGKLLGFYSFVSGNEDDGYGTFYTASESGIAPWLVERLNDAVDLLIVGSTWGSSYEWPTLDASINKSEYKVVKVTLMAEDV